MKNRNPGADIIRCLALFLVVSVHFFLNNGFYNEPTVGFKMFIMNVMRAFFIICVPLFMTLSGYLLRKKELTLGYYKRIVGIVITYLLASAACMLFSRFYLKEAMSLSDVFVKIIKFTGAPYAWYIGMYLGLFLMIPFLNILYKNVPTKNWKICLLGSFIALAAIPAWWGKIYPITYYFIGCYISEYGIKIKKRFNIPLIAACTVIYGASTFLQSYKGVFKWNALCDYNSILSICLTILVFTFFINLNYEKFPKKLSFVFGKLSGLCLGAYLVSYIFDSLFYPILIRKVPVMTQRLWFFLIIVPLVYAASLALSYVLSKIQKLLEIAFAKLSRLFKKNKTET